MEEHSHIEDFFRKRLNSQEFVFQEEDWLKMERKLELTGLSTGTALVRSPVKMMIIIVAGLTAAFVLGWLTNEMVRKNKTSDTLNTGDNYEYKLQNSGSPAYNPDTASKKNITIRKTPPENNQQNANTARENAVTDSPAKIDLVNDASIMPPVQTSDPVEDVEDMNLSSMPVIPAKWPGKMRRLPYKEIDLFNADNDHPIKMSVAVFSESGMPASQPVSRLSLGLAIAPDFNSTGLMHKKSMSPAVGGIVTYAISARWSVSAKIFYNNKKYRSSADYYKVPYDYWQNRTNGVIPDKIDGSCRVIDLPVLFNYAFIQKGFFSFTASAGLGSYFLLDEKYKFTFNGNNPGAATEWTTSENSHVYFSVVNLAMGLSLRTGPRTSMLIEPYLKIPLKQMGWANVNISGMGLIFSFNYHF